MSEETYDLDRRGGGGPKVFLLPAAVSSARPSPVPFLGAPDCASSRIGLPAEISAKKIWTATQTISSNRTETPPPNALCRRQRNVFLNGLQLVRDGRNSEERHPPLLGYRGGDGGALNNPFEGVGAAFAVAAGRNDHRSVSSEGICRRG